MPAAAVVLVMSVIAAMWSQSMPWRTPSRRPVRRMPRSAAGVAAFTAAAMRSNIEAESLSRMRIVADEGGYRNALHLGEVASVIYPFAR